MEKFYNRQPELNRLREISANLSHSKGQLSVVVGRRRVGKTRLLYEAFAPLGENFLYLFISRKSEAALVDEFAEILRQQLGVKFFQPARYLRVPV